MKELHIEASRNTPEIILSPELNRFSITGNSAPEDVRSLYYPVIEWIESFADEIKQKNTFTNENPFMLKIDLAYFNSSSAKFIYDMLLRLRDLKEKENLPVKVEWYYEEEDLDIYEAGTDMAELTGHNFVFVTKPR